MPAIADITVKKNDGTTDIIYVAKVPSSGDNSPAIFRSDAHAAPYAGLKPELVVSSKWNGDKTVRRVSMLGKYNSYATDSTTSISMKIGQVTMDVTFAIPQSLPQADIDEGVSQLSNLVSSTLLRSCLKAGFAPT
jgi:hypothetical protein